MRPGQTKKNRPHLFDPSPKFLISQRFYSGRLLLALGVGDKFNKYTELRRNRVKDGDETVTSCNALKTWDGTQDFNVNSVKNQIKFAVY